MSKKITLNLIFFSIAVFPICLSAQISVFDIDTKTAIPFVKMISETGDVLGVSDIDGIITFKSKDSSSFKTISFHNSSYEVYQVTFEEIKKQTEIYLKRKRINLNEVVLTEKKTQPDYLVLKGYFRSYQLDDDVPKVYSDGIVEYFISLKAKKPLKNYVVENRTFRNKKLFEVKLKKSGLNTTGDRTGPPYIENHTIAKDYNIVGITKTNFKIKQGDETKGVIQSDTLDGRLKITVDITTPESSYTKSLLGYHVKFINFSVSETYKSTTPTALKKWELINRQEYRKQLISSRKVKEPIQVESFHEFYVLETKYISKSELKAIKTSTFFGNEKTKYSRKYWEKLDLYGVPKLPNSIEKLLGIVLEKY